MSSAVPQLWTIGHSTRSFADFKALLSENGIAFLADVRRFPFSRRYPHFNGSELQTALASCGFAYRHFPDLGGRRPARKDSPNTAWRNESFRGYADYMGCAPFEGAMAELLTLAAQTRTAIMCAEALWWQCHRALIADYVKVRGWQVCHILSPGKVEDHPYTSAAKIIDGQLSYRGIL